MKRERRISTPHPRVRAGVWPLTTAVALAMFAAQASAEPDFVLHEHLGYTWRHECVTFPLNPEQLEAAEQSRALIGPGAEATFRELRADKAFISGTGLSLDFGLSNPSIPEVAVKQAMIRAAQEVIVVADHTKIGVESLVKVAPLESIDTLITDSGIRPHDRLARRTAAR